MLDRFIYINSHVFRDIIYNIHDTHCQSGWVDSTTDLIILEINKAILTKDFIIKNMDLVFQKNYSDSELPNLFGFSVILNDPDLGILHDKQKMSVMIICDGFQGIYSYERHCKI